MLDGTTPASARPSLLWVAVGRQRVGKTALLNASAQYFRGLGNPLRVWNADQQNRSHSLSTFFPDAQEAPVGGLEDGKKWIEGSIMDLMTHGYDAVLDVGGGATGFSKMVKEVPLLDAMDGSTARVVGLFCSGPETADLDYLDAFAASGAFMPPASVIVLNAGLVLTDQSATGAFAAISKHRSILTALDQGAKLLIFPALTCMAEVTDRGLTFEEAAAGVARPGQDPLSFFDRARVNRWWSKDIPAFFGRFPPEWLPMPRADQGAPEAAAASLSRIPKIAPAPQQGDAARESA